MYTKPKNRNNEYVKTKNTEWSRKRNIIDAESRKKKQDVQTDSVLE